MTNVRSLFSGFIVVILFKDGLTIEFLESQLGLGYE